jgi:UDP-galactopyranose mutase
VSDVVTRQKLLLNELFTKKQIESYMFWYYTPMALRLSNHFQPQLVIYDCMDELSAFKSAPASIREYEAQLLDRADIVFTGGQSLYESKKHLHNNIHPFPSSIDKEHFAKARAIKEDPTDQQNIPSPRFGFYGVLDERFDIDMIAEVAKRKPDWQMVLIGPVVKINPDSLPKLPNIHYLGGKSYQELPSYLGGWDVAIIPFALNESTKYISPTKTPEYLAGGKPVISTSITDVVRPYGEKGLVHIADTADEFIKAGEQELSIQDNSNWKEKVDLFLSQVSWDRTWYKMLQLITESLNANKIHYKTNKKEKVYV